MSDDNYMDAVFRALAHENRRRMLDTVKECPGIGVGALATGFDVSRIAVMKHLGVLEQAGLVSGTRETSVCCYANQDKFRVTDPNGYEWELYHLLEDTED